MLSDVKKFLKSELWEPHLALHSGAGLAYTLMGLFVLAGGLYLTVGLVLHAAGPVAQCTTPDGTVVEDPEFYLPVPILYLPAWSPHSENRLLTARPDRLHQWFMGRPCATTGKAIWRHDGSDLILLPSGERGVWISTAPPLKRVYWLAGVFAILAILLFAFCFLKAIGINTLGRYGNQTPDGGDGADGQVEDPSPDDD